MKVLITGATGFIGSTLVKTTQFETRCVVRKSIQHGFKDVFEMDDLNGNTNWQGAFDGIDVIIHLAGLAHSSEYDAKAYNEVNCHGTLKLAKEAANARVKRFLFISTALVNGGYTSGRAFSEGDEVHPVNDYARSKYEAELGLKEIADNSKMEVVIIRPPIVYGPNVKANFASLIKLVRRLPVLPFGLAKNSRSFVSIYNFVDFIALCITHEKAIGEVFLISDNEAISTKVLTNRIAKAFGKKIWQLPIPIFCFRLLGVILARKRLIEQLFGDFEIDCSKAVNLLEWQSKVTMEQTLLEFAKDEHIDV